MKLANVLLPVIAAFAGVSILQALAAMLAAVSSPSELPCLTTLRGISSNGCCSRTRSRSPRYPLLRCARKGGDGGSVSQWQLIPLAIVVINGIGGIVFLKNLPIEWPRIFLTSAITAILSAPVWMLLFGSRRDTPAEHFHPVASKSLGERAWKLLVTSLTWRCTSQPVASSFPT